MVGMDDLSHLVVGIDELVPTSGGAMVRYVNLDNAATTPPMRGALDAVHAVLPSYASVHRGSGHKPRVCTAAYERARGCVGASVGADPDRDTVIFTKNTTEAINRLARAMTIDDNAIVLTTVIEHHSNDLPWRARARTLHVRARADGTLDLDHLDHLLAANAGRVALLAVSGASNVTGIVPPIHDIATRVHAAGGRVLIDAAQLAAHRRIDMRSHDDPGHLDYVALSAHKLYAPFGSGALIGRRDGFAPTPDHRGGGTVNAVTVDDVAWADLPDREEAGTPNLLGAVAFAAAARTLGEVGWSRIMAHETALLAHAMKALAVLPGIRVHGPTGVDALTSKVAVIPFTVDGFDHGLVAAILGYEHGIGVRSGCFCAHPYIAHLLGLNAATATAWLAHARRGDKRGAPGMIRISLGLYNDRSDIDRLIAALAAIIAGDFSGEYRSDEHGDYHPTAHWSTTRFDHSAPATAATRWRTSGPSTQPRALDRLLDDTSVTNIKAPS